MKYYINGFTIEADTEEDAKIVADELEKEEDRQILELVEERLKNNNGIRYTLEEVKEMRRQNNKKEEGK